MNFFRTTWMLCVVCPLSACALEASVDAPEAMEPSAEVSVAASEQALQAYPLPINFQLRDMTKDDRPTVVYTREGFVFRLSLTRTGATFTIVNSGDAPLLISSFRLTVDCEGGWSEWGNPTVAVGQRLNADARCRDGAVPSLANVEVRAMATTASDIGYRLPTPTPPGDAYFSFSGFPSELYAGDGSSALVARVDANAVAGTFTNRTAAALAVRVVLEGACPESRFDEPRIDDSGTVRVLPGASLDAVVRCLNGVPTPTLSVRTRPWDAALGATPEVTNVAP